MARRPALGPPARLTDHSLSRSVGPPALTKRKAVTGGFGQSCTAPPTVRTESAVDTGRIAMIGRATRLQPWLRVLCAIAVVAVLILAGPHLFAESAKAARPFRAIALRSLVWLVIAVAPYWGLLRAPAGPCAPQALAPGASLRGGR